MSVLRRHKAGILALAAMGLLAGMAASVEWTPHGVVGPAPAPVVDGKLLEERLSTAAAGERAEAAKTKLVTAEHEPGVAADAAADTPEVARVQALQADLLAAETKRLEQDSETPVAAGENDGGAARHREDLLRITYDRQLATLPQNQQKAVAIHLLRDESALASRVYGTMQDRLKEAEMAAKAAVPGTPFLSTVPAHRVIAGLVGMLGFGLFGVGWFLYRDSREHWSSMETGHDLSWAEEVAVAAAESAIFHPQRLKPKEKAQQRAAEEHVAEEPAAEVVASVADATVDWGAPVAGLESGTSKQNSTSGLAEDFPALVEMPHSEAQPDSARAEGFVEQAKTSPLWEAKDTAVEASLDEDAVSSGKEVSAEGLAETEPAKPEGVASLELKDAVLVADADAAEVSPAMPVRELEGVLHGTIPGVANASHGLARVINQEAGSEFPQSRDVFQRTEWSDEAGPLEEACRDAIASVLLADWGKGVRSYAIVSPSEGDGKSTVIANMAMAMGRANLRVVVVEGNLRNPRLHEMFEVQSVFGLRNLLRGEIDLEQASIDELTSRTMLSHVAVVVGGTGEDVPAEWAKPAAFARLLERLTFAFDLVLVDTSSEDAAAVAKRCGGAILLMRNGATGEAEELRRVLGSEGVYVPGLVVNDFDGAR